MNFHCQNLSQKMYIFSMFNISIMSERIAVVRNLCMDKQTHVRIMWAAWGGGQDEGHTLTGSIIFIWEMNQDSWCQN